VSGRAGSTEDLVVRLRKVEGQVRGLQHLAESSTDIDELLTQLLAARGALHAVAVAALAAHLSEPGPAATSPGALRRYLELVAR
jgi:DNA-binding FrmR family transcriptional regulator